MKSLKLVLSFARTYWKYLFITVISMLLLVAVQLLIPWIIKLLIGMITEGKVVPETFRKITLLSLSVLVIFTLPRWTAIFTQLYGACCRMGSRGRFTEVYLRAFAAIKPKVL